MTVSDTHDMHSPTAAEAEFAQDPVLAELVHRISMMDVGERLPSERELATTLGISRPALRDRIGRLESLGAVERRERSGTYALGLRPEAISEVVTLGLIASRLTMDPLVDVREALEGHAARLACRNRDRAHLESMRRAVETMDSTTDNHRLRDADVAFHRALMQASGSDGLQFFAAVMQQVSDSSIQVLTLDLHHGPLRELHRAILDAVVAQDAQASAVAIENHFVWLRKLLELDTAARDFSPGRASQR